MQPVIKARITVTLKNGVLDPQGKAIAHALGTLGFAGVGAVRQGKVFDIELEGADRAQAEADLEGHVREAAGEHGDRGLCSDAPLRCRRTCRYRNS